MVDFGVQPERTALLNVDLQNLFVEGFPISSPDGPAVVQRVNRLTATCRRLGVLVMHTAHVTRPDASDAGVMADIIPPVRDGLIARGSFAAALHDALDVQPSDTVLEKPRFGAFHGTDLEDRLRAKGIDTLILTGISTNVCVETTAREANVRDFKVFVTSDATATLDMQGLSRHELQRASLAVLGFAFAQVVTVDEMIEKLEASYNGGRWAEPA